MTEIARRIATEDERSFATANLIKLMADDLITSRVDLNDPLKCAVVLIESRFQAQTVNPHLDAAITLAKQLDHD